MKTTLEVLSYVLLDEELGDFLCTYTDEVDHDTIELCYEEVNGQLYDVIVTDTEDSIEVRIDKNGVFFYESEPEELIKAIYKALTVAHTEEARYKETLETIYREQICCINGNEIE